MIEKFLKLLIKDSELYLRIKVRPGSSKNNLREILSDDTFKIDVKAIPEKGKANKMLIKYLSQIFEVKKENIKILSGVKEKTKLIKIIK